MSYKIHPKELENVFALNSRKRYEHFISKVCDWEELWILENDEEKFLIECPEPHVKYVPVWPHPEYAEAYEKDYKVYSPAKIELSSFINNWSPGLNDDGIRSECFQT